MGDTAAQARTQPEFPLASPPKAEQPQQEDFQHDLALLVEASSMLLIARTRHEVLQTTIGLGRRFVSADGYAIWQKRSDDVWVMSSSAGLSDRFCNEGRLPGNRELPAAPMLFEDVEQEPLLTEWQAVLSAEGIRGMLAVPLRIQEQGAGTLVFYWRSRHGFTTGETRMAASLGTLAATALQSAEIIEQSTAELQRSQHALRRSNEDLKRVNDDLNQFAYSASHDLQEPLRSISIYSQLLRRKFGPALDAEADEYLRYLMKGAARMEALVRDLLAYTQASGVAIGAQPVIEAGGALETALSNLKAAILDADVTVAHGPLPQVRIPPVHLTQLFQNLIGNAIKYRREEALHIRIGAEARDGHWLFAVEDNGIGIEGKYKELIFGVFKRLHTADEYSGTGMGLAICQRIVERAGGRIWVESQPGKGSTFYFTLPSDT